MLEQPTRIAVVPVRAGGGERPQPRSHGVVGQDAADEGREPAVGDLPGEELEEAFELIGVAPERRHQPSRIRVRGLDRPHGELQTTVEPLHASEHTHGVPLAEAAVEKIHVVPHAALDPAARVDELEREVGPPAARREPTLARHREHAVDGAVLDELGDRPHGLSLGVL